jgi:hypothetical protein
MNPPINVEMRNLFKLLLNFKTLVKIEYSLQVLFFKDMSAANKRNAVTKIDIQ